MLTQEEKKTIEDFAAYRGSDAEFHKLKADAVAVYRTHCAPGKFDAAWGDHMAFMSEIDNIVPDYRLRIMLREKLLRSIEQYAHKDGSD